MEWKAMEIERLNGLLIRQAAVIEKIQDERDALKADASRFIWLADKLQDVAIDLAEPARFIDDRGDWVNAWRAAIDAAWGE